MNYERETMRSGKPSPERLVYSDLKTKRSGLGFPELLV